jgi:nucleoside-diphosphate-sugar epimerase
MLTIFLTGSDSFIGQAFRSSCLDTTVNVIGIDAVAKEGGDSTNADVRNNDIADLVPIECDAVVHLAALSSDPLCRGKLQECFDVNVMGTLNMMEVARRKSVKQFIFASTEWVYTDFCDTPKDENSAIDIQNIMSEYALSKIVSEQSLRQYYTGGFFDVTILRFGILYGPRKIPGSAVESLYFSVGRNESIVVGSKLTARQFLHVEDAAAAIRAVVGTRGSNCFNVQGSRLISLQEIVEESCHIWGAAVDVVETNPSSPSIRRVSGEKIKEALGWSPRVNLNDGLKTLVAH